MGVCAWIERCSLGLCGCERVCIGEIEVCICVETGVFVWREKWRNL